MAQEVVVEGRTLEEARERAAATLGCAPEDLDLEVLTETKGGLWQRGRVRVRARRRDTTLDGSVGITGGRVAVTDPQPGGKPAMLHPGPHVLVWVNGVPVRETVSVTGADEVTVAGEETKAEAEVSVEVTPDKLGCILRVSCRPAEKYAVQDAGPSNYLIVQARLVERESPPVIEADIYDRLRVLGVVCEPDREAIARAIERGDGEPVVIARGVAVQPSVDARIEYPFLEKQKQYEDSVRGKRQVFSVQQGEVLATKVPGQPGHAGKDVYGHVIEPLPPRDARLKAGHGAVIREDELAIVATISGRPERHGNVVSVVPIYTIPGNADPREGPVKFKGDVVIQGDVLDGVDIQAGGNVEVKGLVANATISAGGSIIVGGNVVGSRIKAGGLALLWEKWSTSWQETAELLDEALAAFQQVYRQWQGLGAEGQRVAPGGLFKALLEGRYRRLPELVEQHTGVFWELAQAVGFDAQHPLARFLSHLRRCLSGQGCLTITGPEELEGYIQGAKEESLVLNEMAQKAAQKAQITASYVQNSVLETTGQVLISGKGCYNCSIYAGAGVVIEGNPGAFRGGRIISKGNVRVRQLGSQAESKTYVQVPKNCFIKAGQAFPEVLLKAGSKVEKVDALVSINLLGE